MKKLGLILTAVVLLSACGKGKEAALSSIETDRFAVTTETASMRDITLELLLNGSVKAWDEATIYPRVEGKLLENILKEGDIVNRNQTIALIERDEPGAVYEPVVVPSTISGIVGKTYLDTGANVTRTTPIALVVSQQDVRIIVEIPERYIGKIHLGQSATFTVEAYGKKEFKAAIYKISPVVDVSSRAVTVELKASNQDKELKSGMFAKVKLVLEHKPQVLSVLKKNIIDKAGKNYVFVFSDTSKPDTTIKMTEVVLGLKGNEYAEITSGIENNTVIANVTFGLKDGSKVKIKEN